MYRALEHLKIAVPGGTQALAPGETVPGFEEWAPWTQHVMLDEKKIRWAPEGITEAEKRRARPLPVEPLAAQMPAVPHVAAPLAAAEVAGPDRLTASAPALDAAPVGLTCELCQRTGFKDAHGLKIHRNRAHKGD